MKRNQPQYFSDHFNIDEARLQKLGVFDTILNFDIKIFVDPLLLKKSSNEIIRNSAKSFDDFFTTLLNLVKISSNRQQKKKISKNHPSFKYL